MANVDIDLGGGQTANVDIDGLETMPPDQQQAAIAAAAQQIRASQSSQADTSAIGAIGYGVNNAAKGFGRTAEIVGSLIGNDAVSGFGKSLEGATAAPKNYQATNLAGDLRSGDYSKAFEELPRAALEAAPDLVATLGADALSGPLGAVGIIAGRNLGDNATAAAKANNEAPTSTDALVRGGLATAAQAGLQAVGLGKIGPGAALLETAPALAKPAIAAGLDAAGAASADATGQVITTGQVDPYQAAAAGLQGAAARAVSMTPELARVGIKAGADSYAASTLEPPASTDDAASIIRVNSLLDQFRQQAQAAGGSPTDTAVANTVTTELLARAAATVGDLRDAGTLTPKQARNILAGFRDQAGRGYNSPGSLVPLFTAINNTDLPDEAVGTLQSAARDLNTLATQGTAKTADGPFRQLGGAVATGAALVGGLHHPAAVIGILAGHNKAAPVGRAIGGALDGILATNTPPVALRAKAARQILQAAGQSAGPSPLDGLGTLRDAVGDVMRQAEPLPFTVSAPALPDPATVAVQTNRAWNKANPAPSYPDPEGAWSPAEAQASKAKATANAYLAGVALPGASTDPLAGVPTLPPQSLPDASDDLANQAATQQARAVAAARVRQELRNKIADYNGSIDTQAQRRLDNSAVTNAVKLAAAHKLPGTYPDVDQIAADAAVNSALSQARNVITQAGRSPDTGLPPDPVPVVVPIDSLRQPPQERPQSLAQPRNVLPARTPAETAPPASASPEQAPPGGLLVPGPAAVGIPQTVGDLTAPAMMGTPWERYVANGNPLITRQAVHDAVDRTFSPADAAMIKAHTGGHDAAILRAIQANLRKLAGKDAYERLLKEHVALARSLGIPEVVEELQNGLLTPGTSAART